METQQRTEHTDCSTDASAKRRKLETALATEASLIELVMSSPITLPLAIQGQAVTMANTHIQANNLVAAAVAKNNQINLATSTAQVFNGNVTNGNTVTNGNQTPVSPTRNPINTQENTTAKEQRERVIAVDHCKAEQIALLTALSQVVSCTQEAIKILRESQERSLDLEHKRFRFQLEAEEKRLMMESEHYRKVETMFSGLIQAISQTPTAATTPPTTNTTSIVASDTCTTPPVTVATMTASTESPSVKVEVDT